MSFEGYKFKYEFRDYQKRILTELRKHLQDDKIHVVAPPGAGKTILGLQLMIELGQPTLICVPTIALREQWIQRFKEDFNINKKDMDNISYDLEHPKEITVCTYQALYSLYKQTTIDQTNNLALLKDDHISTVILDEAHHLKKSWWEALTSILNELGDIKTVSLTATPPYDVMRKEWNNYLMLCGEIDEEISVPELVKQGDLCPHQDFLYLNYPSESDLGQFEDYQVKAKEIFDTLCKNDQFITAISLHPGIIHLEDKIDYFINEFDYFISLLSFLRYQKINCQDLLPYIKDLPDFDMRQMEILLTYCLFKDKHSYHDFSKLFRDIKRSLNEMGAIEEGKVNLIYSSNIKKLLSQNKGKLRSIHQIIKNEYQSLKEKLKLVVVTDHIKEEINDVSEEIEVSTIGAIPIFKSIRQQLTIHTIVLTGKVVIIPIVFKETLLEIGKEMGIDLEAIVIQELEYDFDYAKVTLKGVHQRNMVPLITALFKKVEVHVLIGTSALIGEGWDAPFINALIMASFTSTYVMSNQIRGRAIRVDKNNVDKTSNIWHLVCVEKVKKDHYRLGLDYEMLNRRFIAFEGVYLDENKIGSGIERLGVPNQIIDVNRLNQMNETMVSHANNREQTAKLWKEAVNHYVPVKKTHLAKEYIPRLTLHKQKLVRNSLLYASLSFILGITWSMMNYPYEILIQTLFIGTGIFNSSKAWTYQQDTTIVRELAKALFHTFIELDMMTHESEFIVYKENQDFCFYLQNASFKENNMFSLALKEMFSDIKNPRYIVEMNKVYYPVPSLFGKNKKGANVLKKHLKHTFRRVKMKYMKTEEGKRELLALKLKQVNDDEKRK